MKRFLRLLLLTALFLPAPFVLVVASDPSTAGSEPSPKANLDELRAKAGKGDAVAQFNLGLMYATGDGVAKDSTEAVKWYRKAAEQGIVDAEYNLGVIYANGQGVAENLEEAVKWYRKAAEQGDADAQFNLGVMYANGQGVAENLEEAGKWYRKAAEQGQVPAQFNLAVAYVTGSGVATDPAEALKWYRKAAVQGDVRAQFNLGVRYDTGHGVAKDPSEAVEWYRKAAEQGYADAQNNLGVMYANGVGVTKDPAEAAKWYRKAAEQRNAKAQFCLGLMYARGDGVPKNGAEAIRWYRKAAAQGDADAQCNLGVMYNEGEGVPKDEVEALAWFNISAAAGIESAVKNRGILERRIGREATLLAQQRSKEIFKEIEAAKTKEAAPRVSASAGEISDNLPTSFGSGAIVSSQGHVLTAAHVVAGANSIKVVTAQGIRTAKVLRVDESNDELAILKIDKGSFAALPVAASRRVRLGQVVATIGFPNVEIQGFSPKVTCGEISSLNGVADDPRSWQISVPVQPGNSGGPLLDENGNLIGVVVAKLGLRAAAATGDIPQYVNYAVKSAYALPLLEPYLGADAPEPNQPDQKPNFEDMVAKAQQSVVLILCY